MLSAALAGLAGATKAIVAQSATLTDMHWTTSGEVILMTLVGGMGTMLGPVVGAFVILAMQNYLSTFGQWVMVIQGAIFVICVLSFRRGLIGEIANRFKIRCKSGNFPRRRLLAGGGLFLRRFRRGRGRALPQRPRIGGDGARDQLLLLGVDDPPTNDDAEHGEAEHDLAERAGDPLEGVAEGIAAEAEDHRPDDAAGGVVEQELPPSITVRPGEESGENAQQRDETAEKHDFRAMIARTDIGRV